MKTNKPQKRYLLGFVRSCRSEELSQFDLEPTKHCSRDREVRQLVQAPSLIYLGDAEIGTAIVDIPATVSSDQLGKNVDSHVLQRRSDHYPNPKLTICCKLSFTNYLQNYPTRIRTWTNRTKICCATVTLSGKPCRNLSNGRLKWQGASLENWIRGPLAIF